MENSKLDIKKEFMEDKVVTEELVENKVVKEENFKSELDIKEEFLDLKAVDISQEVNASTISKQIRLETHKPRFKRILGIKELQLKGLTMENIKLKIKEEFLEDKVVTEEFMEDKVVKEENFKSELDIKEEFLDLKAEDIFQEVKASTISKQSNYIFKCSSQLQKRTPTATPAAVQNSRNPTIMASPPVTTPANPSIFPISGTAHTSNRLLVKIPLPHQQSLIPHAAPSTYVVATTVTPCPQVPLSHVTCEDSVNSNSSYMSAVTVTPCSQVRPSHVTRRDNSYSASVPPPIVEGSSSSRDFLPPLPVQQHQFVLPLKPEFGTYQGPAAESLPSRVPNHPQPPFHSAPSQQLQQSVGAFLNLPNQFSYPAACRFPTDMQTGVDKTYFSASVLSSTGKELDSCSLMTPHANTSSTYLRVADAQAGCGRLSMRQKQAKADQHRINRHRPYNVSYHQPFRQQSQSCQRSSYAHPRMSREVYPFQQSTEARPVQQHQFLSPRNPRTGTYQVPAAESLPSRVSYQPQLPLYSTPLQQPQQSWGAFPNLPNQLSYPAVCKFPADMQTGVDTIYSPAPVSSTDKEFDRSSLLKPCANTSGDNLRVAATQDEYDSVSRIKKFLSRLCKICNRKLLHSPIVAKNLFPESTLREVKQFFQNEVKKFLAEETQAKADRPRNNGSQPNDVSYRQPFRQQSHSFQRSSYAHPQTSGEGPPAQQSTEAFSRPCQGHSFFPRKHGQQSKGVGTFNRSKGKGGPSK